ncbi:phosphorylase family protein [Actinacidiphila bryophytorum]|uniref:Phosphorylase superfamily protein n=1 Tax=Actinacidiphila bryophytorum TaxID=1436133 RepID=A0A9W4H5U3_9ACTN|nr:1-hydroxy-2-methyl-2-butenyl 4-diphosphate reductase [Actinacidiphila bryophytorum]MBM9439681.1 1-hydroxy-2-methyl-2-butenyl 4-diphosphate reductase [Actinacidiphila bryophytorum]MBN6543151.1 1-hydroxy-2-methyl-2-butenyl 4-diphosphate reductase [Actinacidiphila bryophytorum]CAG7653013.1 Phosphorylase superfamily protein [Actinacidiphila bryophytorum]
MGHTRPPLLVVCALRIERFALRAGAARGAAHPVTVLRTGMGPTAAEEAVRTALHDPALRGAAVVTTGFCAGLAAGMRPGDIVVSHEGDDSAGLAAALKAAGHTVHTGPLAESDHVVRGAERTALAATGAIAVDMESAAMRRAALAEGAQHIAAARVVVDTPEYELVRVGTLRTGIIAFRVLRDLVPAFLDWHRTTAAPPEVS